MGHQKYCAIFLLCVAAGQAHATPEDQVNDQIKSLSTANSIGVTYNYGDRHGGEKESTSDGLTFNYGRALANGQREFWLLSGSRDDFDTPVALSKANSIAGSVAYGRMIPLAQGLQLTLGGLLATSHTDVAGAPDLDLNSQSAGVILGLRQSFPLSSKVFAAVRTTVVPRFTHKKQLSNNYDSVDYTATPGADVYYMVKPNLFLGTGVEATFSNKDVALSRRNHLYRTGLGLMYKMDSYSTTLDYKREMTAGHHGNLFSVSLAKSF